MKNKQASKRSNTLHLATLAVMILLISALAFSLSACSKKDASTVLSEPFYDLTAVFDDTANTLSLAEDVIYCNATGEDLKELKLHLYPNAFSDGATSSPFLAEELKSVKSYGGIEVLSAKIDRINCEFEVGGVDDGILTVPCNLNAGDTLCLSLTCEIALPRCTARFGITDSTVNLTGFYPVLCRYENGAWREDAYTALGDPFYTDSSSFAISLTLPSDYVVGASGIMTETPAADGIKTVTAEADHIRDFAVALSKSFKEELAVAALPSGDVSVRYLYLKDKSAPATAALAASAITTFSTAFGDYPYDTYTVVEAPINSGGMEYGGLAIVSSALSDNRDTVIHETAHQWWYNGVGNDQINAAWLDEGLAEFCTAYYYRLAGDDAAYSSRIAAIDKSLETYTALPSANLNQNMQRSLSSFSTQNEYVAVVYERGALLFSTLLELVEEDALNSALATYYADNTFAVADLAALSAAFDKSGLAVGGIITSFVNGTAKV